MRRRNITSKTQATENPSLDAKFIDMDAAKIAHETAKHYGNMRFTMFTVYTTITGALLSIPFTSVGSAFMLAAPHQKYMICMAGLIASILFGLSEKRVSDLVHFYQDASFKYNIIQTPQGHVLWKYIILATTLLPSIITGAFWIFLASGLISIPKTI